MQPIELYDTTLRDGMQGEGMSLSAHEKLRVAHKLDELGIDLIEAGFPSSNPKELELFELLSGERFEHARIAAFGMTRRRGIRAEQDPSLQTLAACFAPVCTLVGKTWALHLEKVTRVDRDENLRMISESIAYLTARGKHVIYDAEHFFDAFDDDPDYALACLRAAADAGARTVTCCDTNGGSLPDRIARALAAASRALDGCGTSLGIHCHNDAGCGVADTLAAVGAGATHVQGTMNGYGERCGNANLTTVIPNLQLKLGRSCVTEAQLRALSPASRFFDELLNLTPNPNQPYVGRNAFAHKGGMHVAGVAADPRTFEHIPPEVVGNARAILISELSGRGTVRTRAALVGIELDDDDALRVLERVKELEHRGYQFEAADGSFELLMRRQTGDYEPLFTLESWRVIVEKRADGPALTEATVKIWCPAGEHGHRQVHTAEGNGPVNALDGALRKALVETYPRLAHVELSNFKVRILDSSKGTEAITRVLLDSTDGEREWGAIGVSENVIDASWEALVDSLEYAMRVSSRTADAAGVSGAHAAELAPASTASVGP